MFESDGLLPTLSQVLQPSESVERNNGSRPSEEDDTLTIARAQRKAEGEWRSAIAALEQLLRQMANETQCDCQGLILSAPAPVLSQRSPTACFHVGTFTPEAFNRMLVRQFQLPAAEPQPAPTLPQKVVEYPLFPVDPLASEQFCLVLTAKFALVMVLGENRHNHPAFQFSFEPEIVDRAWQTLRSRLLLTVPHQLPTLDALVRQFPPRHPDYRLVTQFARHLLEQFPDGSSPAQKKVVALEPQKRTSISRDRPLDNNGETVLHRDAQLPELELLQALTHEVRTPLTTIRMLARLLLKQRRNLSNDAIERLETIDRECTEQIDRMELIFRAAELETTSCDRPSLQLVPIALEQVIQQNIPHWQKQAQRRNITLDIVLPEKLPTIISNPEMLDRVLRGVMESFTRSLPPGSHMRVQVATAGHQIKLQLLSRNASLTHSLKSMGQLLVFQPETGSLTLNWEVTKNLFNALGGKLLLRQRPQQGEELTVFLPLGNPQPDLAAGMFGKKVKAKK